MTDRPPRRRRIYVAGPMSQGDVRDHVRRAIDVAEALLALGYAPFVPHLSWTWHERYPHDRDTWLALDIEWLRLCDAVVRLPGPSVGADREVAEARRLGIPVYGSVEELVAASERPDTEDPNGRDLGGAAWEANDVAARDGRTAASSGVDHPD